MNINLMMQQAKKMQEELETKKKELSKKEFVVEKQGITVVMMGDRKLKSVAINDVLIDPEDKDILEDLTVIAINEAIDKINEAEAEIQSSAMPSGMPF